MKTIGAELRFQSLLDRIDENIAEVEGMITEERTKVQKLEDDPTKIAMCSFHRGNLSSLQFALSRLRVIREMAEACDTTPLG